jgi:hypothetical protein
MELYPLDKMHHGPIVVEHKILRVKESKWTVVIGNHFKVACVAMAEVGGEASAYNQREDNDTQR